MHSDMVLDGSFVRRVESTKVTFDRSFWRRGMFGLVEFQLPLRRGDTGALVALQGDGPILLSRTGIRRNGVSSFWCQVQRGTLRRTLRGFLRGRTHLRSLFTWRRLLRFSFRLLLGNSGGRGIQAPLLHHVHHQVNSQLDLRGAVKRAILADELGVGIQHVMTGVLRETLARRSDVRTQTTGQPLARGFLPCGTAAAAASRPENTQSAKYRVQRIKQNR